MISGDRRGPIRAVLLALVVALSTASCALPAGSAADRHAPLRGYLLGPEVGGLSFHLNRPAHVAVFHVSPGRGASMIYPRPGLAPASGFTTTGRVISYPRQSASRSVFQTAMSGSRLSGPQFFFMIASEQPLNLNEFGPYGMSLTHHVGLQTVASLNGFRTMERLAEISLPSTAMDGSWMTDVYVYWPEAMASEPAAGYVLLRCNGYQMYVRLEYLAAVQEVLCSTTESRAPITSPAPRDSTETVVPQRRPPRTSVAVGESVRASTQLADTRRERRTPGTDEVTRRTEPGSWQAEARARRAEMERARRPSGSGSTVNSQGGAGTGEARTRRTPERQPSPAAPATRTPEARPAPPPPRQPETTQVTPAPTRGNSTDSRGSSSPKP